MSVLIILLVIMCAVLLYREIKRPKFDGEMVISYTDDGKTLFSLELDRDPNMIAQSKYIVFKVVHEDFKVVEDGPAE